MPLRKKTTLKDQIEDFADRVGDQVGEAVETLRPQVQSAVSSTREAIGGFVDTTARPAWEDAKAKAGPAWEDAREKAAPALNDARVRAAEAARDAREKAAPALNDARVRAAEAARDARAAAEERVGSQEPEKKGRWRRFALFAVVAAAVGAVAKKVQDGRSKQDVWQSSYVPTPAPAPAPSTSTSSATPPGSAAAPTLPSGTEVEVVGLLQPSEGTGAVDQDPGDDVVPQLRIADLQQRVDDDLYSAYVVADGGLLGLAEADLEAVPESGRFTALRNLLYGLEWWVFGLFAVFVWWRWARDATRAADESPEPRTAQSIA
jgi:hypothetical protein